MLLMKATTEGEMSDTLLYSSAFLAQQHIDELRRDADNDRLARTARQRRRQRRRVAMRGLRPAVAR
jgi:hypothetical protein